MASLKQILYITSFIFLGLLVSSILHAVIEWPLLVWRSNQLAEGSTFLWDNWTLLHGGGGTALWVIGAIAGFLLGRHFWRRIYIENMRG